MSWLRGCVVASWVCGLVCLGADYGAEAEAFLRRMPEGLQQRQTAAIAAARAGQGGLLQAVRASRNHEDLPPAGVWKRELAGGHRLYGPVSPGKGPLPLLIYFHGGGWVFGGVNSCSRFCGELALSGRCLVLDVHYRLAPEHPYPQGLEDCLAAVSLARREVLDWGGSPELISLGGDSSGGNLALCAALRLGAGGQLRSLLLFYPVVKAWNDGSASWRRYGKGYGLDGALMEEFNRAYCGSVSPRLGDLSPWCAGGASLSRLPKVLLVGAERDILHDQGCAMVRRLRSAGVEVRHEVLPGSVHLFVTVRGQEGAFRRAVELAAAWLRPVQSR